MNRFTTALRRALPGLPLAVLSWRLQFVVWSDGLLDGRPTESESLQPRVMRSGGYGKRRFGNWSPSLRRVCEPHSTNPPRSRQDLPSQVSSPIAMLSLSTVSPEETVQAASLDSLPGARFDESLRLGSCGGASIGRGGFGLVCRGVGGAAGALGQREDDAASTTWGAWMFLPPVSCSIGAWI